MKAWRWVEARLHLLLNLALDWEGSCQLQSTAGIIQGKDVPSICWTENLLFLITTLGIFEKRKPLAQCRESIIKPSVVQPSLVATSNVVPIFSSEQSSTCGYSTVKTGAAALSWLLLRIYQATNRRIVLIFIFRFVRKICEKRQLASSCLSDHMELLGSHWTDFHEMWYLMIFRKSFEKPQISLKSDKNNWYFNWRPMYIFHHISLISSQNEKCFRQKL